MEEGLATGPFAEYALKFDIVPDSRTDMDENGLGGLLMSYHSRPAAPTMCSAQASRRSPRRAEARPLERTKRSDGGTCWNGVGTVSVRRKLEINGSFAPMS